MKSHAQVPEVPPAVKAGVRRDLARQLRVSPQSLEIIQARPQTYPDTCLGLKPPQTACAPVLVVGWRLTVTDGSQAWFYRTNDSGTILLVENLGQPFPLLPETIASGVIALAAERFDQAPETLEITAATPKIWSDGCLGLGGLNFLCTEQLTPGWEVVVESQLETMPQRWVYRTNQSGSLIEWDVAGSQVIGQLITPPTRIDPAQQPPGLEESAVFRMITSGGITNRTTTTILLANGQIQREISEPNGRQQTRILQQVKPEDVQIWQELLRQRRFNRFNTIYFTPGDAPATSTEIFLSSSEATTQFNDLEQYKLPADLLAILGAWEQLVQRGRLPRNVLPDAPLPR